MNHTLRRDYSFSPAEHEQDLLGIVEAIEALPDASKKSLDPILRRYPKNGSSFLVDHSAVPLPLISYRIEESQGSSWRALSHPLPASHAQSVDHCSPFWPATALIPHPKYPASALPCYSSTATETP